MALIGVVPAAGRAERLQPLDGSKEVVEVGGRPVMDYVVERIRAVDPEEIRLVTRPDKADVASRARELRLSVVYAAPATLSESLLAGIEGLPPEDTVLIGLPDSIWEPVDAFAALVEAIEAGADVALGLFRSSEPERGDVVEVGPDGTVRYLHVKSPASTGDLVWGAVAARTAALEGLHAHAEPGDAFAALARDGRVRAVIFGTEFLDIGTSDALARARELLG